MKTSFGRELVGLRILFAVIGLLFVLADVIFIIANWSTLSTGYQDFGSSLYNIYTCSIPFIVGMFALFYLIPTLLGVLSKKLSVIMFDFLATTSRILIYFPLAPLIAILIILLLYVLLVERNLLLPQSLEIEAVFGWLFYVLIYIEAFLMFFTYRRSRCLYKKR